MGLIMFIILIGSLIVGNVRSVFATKNTDNVSEEIDDYYDDFETL